MNCEVSRAIPPDLPERVFLVSTPLLTAYGCVLLERATGRGYVYTAVNVSTGQREVLCRRASPLMTAGADEMVERLRRSRVAGAGRLEADRPFGAAVNLARCHEIITTLFREILPQYGYTVRAEQIALAECVLDAISRRSVLLAEAGVGTGKTLAYLTTAAIAKRGRLGDHWNMSYYTDVPYIALAHMPIVIATSSIALQKALHTDHIPALSDILLASGIIRTPLTSVIRKGREHYVCERNLRAHIPFAHDKQHILMALLNPNARIDLAECEMLTPHDKRRISVPSRCRSDCPHLEDCAYLRFREHAQSPEIDFQICNHNYLLADVEQRENNRRPLIPNYQMLIIDEAHKFADTARSMHCLEMSGLTAPGIRERVAVLNLSHEAVVTARKLAHESRRLFDGVDTMRHLRNIGDIAGRLHTQLTAQPGAARILGDLAQVREQALALACGTNAVYHLDGNILRAVPTDADNRLYDTLWSSGVPTILTSGTLSASGAGTSCADFTRIKRKLGLERAGNRLSEVSLPPTFDYYKNCLVYISEGIPFPEPRNPAYIDAITDEIERLVRVSNGHAAVLFTSYNVMGRVFAALKARAGMSGLPFPMFRLDKGGVRAIERFKQCGGGVLFASGALWEGIDIPGDALSLIIIVKLPFAVPDASGAYERSLYKSLAEYKRRVILPDCLIKTKQAHGRVFRTEDDTGAVAFMDCRMAEGGAYRDYILRGLPHSRVTSDLRVLEDFFRAVKPPAYFE